MSVHPAAPHHLPAFITAPGETDVLLVGVAVFLVIAVLVVGTLFLRLHTLPERIAHKSRKLQFEIVAVLGLLALFTHVHLFWVAGLLLALIDFPDISGSLSRIVAALERIAHGRDAAAAAPDGPTLTSPPQAGGAIHLSGEQPAAAASGLDPAPDRVAHVREKAHSDA